jgi:hypothetical protein
LHILHIQHIKFSFPYCAYSPVFYHILHIVHITHMLNMYFQGFELSDDEEMPEAMHPDLPALDTQAPENDNEDPDTLQEQPALPPAAMHLPPFDFHQSIRRLGGNTATMFKALEQLDAHIPPGPVVVLSERAGGGVR